MGIQINTALLLEEEQDGVKKLPEGVYPEGEEIPADRVHIFSVNGRAYTIPRRPNPRVAFRYLRSVRQSGGDDTLAMATLLAEVLGDAVFDAMCDEDLDEEQYMQVMKIVEKQTMGAMKRTLGN